MFIDLLWGSFLAKELRGVDDRAVVDSICRSCLSHPSVKSTVVLVYAGHGVLMGLLACTLGVSGLKEVLVVGFALALALSPVMLRWSRHRALKLLPDVLRSLGRCTGCGYKLARESGERCPECGHAPEGAGSTTERH